MIIETIYSKIKSDKILHLVYRGSKNEEKNSRYDLIDANNFIQCSVLNMDEGKTFVPHRHIFKKRTYEKQIAQESWVVIKGKVECTFYDLDDTILETKILNPGDVSFTLEAGHNYKILEDDTLVYEYKTGPYEGQKLDKTFLTKDKV